MFLFKIYREPELCEFFSNFFYREPTLFGSQEFEYKFKIINKNDRCEPELCEPFFQLTMHFCSHFSMVHIMDKRFLIFCLSNL